MLSGLVSGDGGGGGGGGTPLRPPSHVLACVQTGEGPAVVRRLTG